MSIAKLRVGQEAYQLSGVAQSLDDYYTGAGEAAGEWFGVGAERLGLAGEVVAGDLQAVLAGMAPGSGGLSPNGEAIRPHPRRVPGFDLTFKPPKSVSVLFAVSDDPRVQAAIVEACEHAVRETLSWLEREAAHVRRGSGDGRWLTDLARRDPDAAAEARTQVLPARGLVAAVFRHRTSRAGDPLLHWHVLVPNLAEGPDGRWTALVHPDVYQAVRPAGEVFQTVLRDRLSLTLGLEWRPGRHVPEVGGIPEGLCDLFSKRSQERDAWLAATGLPADAEGRQAAVLATRRHKPELESERFDAAWKAEAIVAGWGPDQAEALVASLQPTIEPTLEERWQSRHPADGAVGPVDADADVWIAGMVRARLTDKDSSFTRPQLYRAVAASLGDGATMATIERVVARAVASPVLVPVADPGGPRWTSAELVGVERRFLQAVEVTRGRCVPVAAGTVDGALVARPGLGADQEAAVRALAGSRDGVAVLVGPAGTGKTFTLDTVREAYAADSYQVVGAAPSARAALELEAGAGIRSSTLHRLIGDWDRGVDVPTARTLLVVDEAGMAGIREIESVVTGVTAAGGRVILAGDHRQLPEVTAGGGFTAVATTGAGTVATLTVNRRQHELWEREALAELRAGHVPRAVAAYRDQGRVVVAADRASMVDEAVIRWFDAHADGLYPVLVAGTNDMVDALNAAVRAELVAAGGLHGRPVGGGAGGRDLRAGDRVVLRANSYRQHTATGDTTAVFNSQTGTVVGGGDVSLLVRLDAGRDVVLDEGYLRSGGVAHGYALTSHRTQGGTWDLAIAVGTDGLYREAAYTQLSRGSHSNWLVVTRPEIDAVDAELERHDHGIPLPGEEPDDVDHELQRRLTRSGAKVLALARDPYADHVDHLARTTDLATIEGRARHAQAAEQAASAATGVDPVAVGRVVARTQHTAEHVAVGERVKAWDRHNIGTVTHLDDRRGIVGVHFVSPDGAEADRELTWSQVTIVDPRSPDARPLDDIARQTLDRLLGPLQTDIEAWHTDLARRGAGPLDRYLNERAAVLAIDRTAARLAADQPDWLTFMLGERPTTSFGAQVWDDSVRHLAAHRLRGHIPDHVPGFGPPPLDPTRLAGWEQASAWTAGQRLWLDTHHNQPVLPITRTRSRTELATRRAELDTVLATAPPDQRGVIDRLRHGHDVPLAETTDLLREALATQDARRSWILAHWPHVVEHAEINRTLLDRSLGVRVRCPP